MSQNRPYIVMNVAMSVDGKISTVLRERLRFSSPEDWALMDEIRAQADAILVGARTIRAEDPPVRIKSREYREARRSRGQSPHPLSIILSRSLDLPLDGRYFRNQHVSRLIVTTEDVMQDAIQRVAAHTEICQIGHGSVDIEELCAHLKTRGVDRLLVEGGGDVNMAFLRENLMDEIYVTVSPVVIGGSNAPTPVDGEGFTADHLPALALIDHRRVGDEIFLHYRVIHPD